MDRVAKGLSPKYLTLATLVDECETPNNAVFREFPHP